MGWLLLTDISWQAVATTSSMCGMARMPLRLEKCTASGNAVERDKSSFMRKICRKQDNDRAAAYNVVMYVQWRNSSRKDAA